MGLISSLHVGLPGPGIEPVSPALGGGFLITGPPWEGQHTFKKRFHMLLLHDWESSVLMYSILQRHIKTFPVPTFSSEGCELSQCKIWVSQHIAEFWD